MTDTATPPEHDRENQESSEDEGKQSQEQDSEERRQGRVAGWVWLPCSVFASDE